MRAVILEHFGCTLALSYRYIDEPIISDNDVLVRVHYTAVNRQDCQLRQGEFKFFKPEKFPFVIGTDFSGIVEKVGANVTNFKVGDEVFGSTHYSKSGAYAELLSVDQNELTHKPPSVSFKAAAALPLAGLTALQALRDLGQVEENDKVCINGASGGVGRIAVQLAKYYGADVTAICSGKNCSKCEENGADAVLDYNTDDVKKFQEKFDVFFDVVGKSCFWDTKKIINKKGIFITTQPSAKAIFQCICTKYSKRKASVIMVQSNKQDLDYLAVLADQQVLIPTISKTFSLSEANKAQQFLEDGNTEGKILLEL